MAAILKAFLCVAIVGRVMSSPTELRPLEPPQSNSSSVPVHHPTHCGEYGNFTLKWDDEPIFNPSDNNGIVYPPVFNPYHHLFFSNGYAYAPPPDGPYQPISKPHLAMFFPNATSKDIGSPNAGSARLGEIGSGPRASFDTYWFNAYGAYFGCDNNWPGSCSIVVRGFKYDDAQGKEVLVARKNMNVPPCIMSHHCHMEFYEFSEFPAGLSGLQISARVDDEPRIFFMDNLQLGWYNNSCEAGLLRLTVRK